MGALERAHYAKKSEIARATEVTSMEYVRRRQKPLGNRAAENYPCTSVYRLRGIKPAKDWTVYKRASSEGKNVSKVRCGLFRLEERRVPKAGFHFGQDLIRTDECMDKLLIRTTSLLIVANVDEKGSLSYVKETKSWHRRILFVSV